MKRHGVTIQLLLEADFPDLAQQGLDFICQQGGKDPCTPTPEQQEEGGALIISKTVDDLLSISSQDPLPKVSLGRQTKAVYNRWSGPLVWTIGLAMCMQNPISPLVGMVQ